MGARGLHGCVRLAVAAGLLAFLTACPKPPEPEPPPVTPAPTPVPIPTPTPRPTPTPPPYVPAKRLDVGKIFNGLQLRATLETEHGTTAMVDREDPGSYSLDLHLKVRVPKPYKELAEITKLNPQLPTDLTELPALLEAGRVSPAYDELYRLKVASVQSSLLRLDAVLTRHNFFDCETIVELQHPGTKRRALLMQSDMDTDTDGSDSDRVPEIDGSSVTFQPFTSYKWAKKTAQPNSFIAARELKLKQLLQQAAGQPAARQAEAKAALKQLSEEISDLKKYSYLVAGADPYVVLPGSLFATRFHSPYAPAIGDYCVVIYGNVLYPAVVGDVGPNNILGESSLRICRQISARADANNRAVEDLKVTYLLFPGTAEKPFEAPNLDKWRTRCDVLLHELGGYGGQLFAWEDLTKPKPPPATPAPVATPAPATPAPATPAPAASPTPVKS